MRSHFVRVLSLILSISVCGCGDIFGEMLEYPDGVRYFDDAMFRPMWEELKACSKLDGSLRRVGFFHVPRETLPSALHGVRTLGVYFPESNRIFIIDSEMWNRDVLRHEMMHALLRNESGHPPEYFGYDGLCGHV